MTNSTQVSSPATQAVDPSLVTYTHVIYALHTLSVIIGITGAASIVFMFVFGVPSIVAVIMNYARLPAVRGTYLESHFRWQIRTFWYALAWMIVVGAVSLLLMIVLVGFLTLPVGLVLVGIWVVYRVARGWLSLRDGRPMHV